LDTESDPGGSNLVQTALADTILVKAEKTGQILALLSKDTIPYGNKEYPKYNAKTVGQFIDESTSAYTDVVPNSFEDGTDGLDKVLFTPRDFGITASYTNRILKKVTPASIRFFREQEAKMITRGLERQALRGDGTGQNATGVVEVASSVSAAGNIYLTFNDAIGTLAANDTENIVAVMHRKTWQEFKNLRVINESYRASIDPKSLKIDDIQVILSNNTDSSVATTGNVLLGDFSHYMMTKQGTMETIEDPYSNATTRKVNVTHTMLVDMGAMFSNSFAKFSVTF
jgi:HK97 family phage major capsid protein